GSATGDLLVVVHDLRPPGGGADRRGHAGGALESVRRDQSGIRAHAGRGRAVAWRRVGQPPLLQRGRRLGALRRGSRARDAPHSQCAAVAQGRAPALEVYGTDYATPDGTAVRGYI